VSVHDTVANGLDWRRHDACVIVGESFVKSHPRYSAAKGGSAADAWALAAEWMPGVDADLLSRWCADKPFIAPVHARGAGTNKIPDAMAAWLAK